MGKHREPGSPRTFPVLFGDYREREAYLALGCPRRVPWAFLAPHEEQAKDNHDQTLSRLAQRGGLDPAEMLGIVRGKGLRDVMAICKWPKAQIVAELNAELERWAATKNTDSTEPKP